MHVQMHCSLTPVVGQQRGGCGHEGDTSIPPFRDTGVRGRGRDSTSATTTDRSGTILSSVGTSPTTTPTTLALGWRWSSIGTRVGSGTALAWAYSSTTSGPRMSTATQTDPTPDPTRPNVSRRVRRIRSRTRRGGRAWEISTTISTSTDVSKLQRVLVPSRRLVTAWWPGRV